MAKHVSGLWEIAEDKTEIIKTQLNYTEPRPLGHQLFSRSTAVLIRKLKARSSRSAASRPGPRGDRKPCVCTGGGARRLLAKWVAGSSAWSAGAESKADPGRQRPECPALSAPLRRLRGGSPPPALGQLRARFREWSGALSPPRDAEGFGPVPGQFLLPSKSQKMTPSMIPLYTAKSNPNSTTFLLRTQGGMSTISERTSV